MLFRVQSFFGLASRRGGESSISDTQNDGAAAAAAAAVPSLLCQSSNSSVADAADCAAHPFIGSSDQQKSSSPLQIIDKSKSSGPNLRSNNKYDHNPQQPLGDRSINNLSLTSSLPSDIVDDPMLSPSTNSTVSQDVDNCDELSGRNDSNNTTTAADDGNGTAAEVGDVGSSPPCSPATAAPASPLPHLPQQQQHEVVASPPLPPPPPEGYDESCWWHEETETESSSDPQQQTSTSSSSSFSSSSSSPARAVQPMVWSNDDDGTEEGTAEEPAQPGRCVLNQFPSVKTSGHKQTWAAPPAWPLQRGFVSSAPGGLLHTAPPHNFLPHHHHHHQAQQQPGRVPLDHIQVGLPQPQPAIRHQQQQLGLHHHHHHRSQAAESIQPISAFAPGGGSSNVLERRINVAPDYEFLPDSLQPRPLSVDQILELVQKQSGSLRDRAAREKAEELAQQFQQLRRQVALLQEENDLLKKQNKQKQLGWG